IVLWTETKYRSTKKFSAINEYMGRVGGSALGEPGKRAELVGEEAARELLNNILHKSALDGYMGDQIIPYMAITGNSTIKTANLTPHILTNIYVSEKITGRKFSYDGELGKKAIITVK
ncbi:MAG TPA: RNA 3'-terminal phosphate cyclase, partial [Methanobacterium sp.]|nr:RNA 3'-terminal phosphate cyclase [Methanobacterium sp.]